MLVRVVHPIRIMQMPKSSNQCRNYENDWADVGQNNQIDDNNLTNQIS